MIVETLCDYKDGLLVDEVYQLIEIVVAEKHQVETEDLVIEDKNDNNTLVYKEQYQDEINDFYDILEGLIINYFKYK